MNTQRTHHAIALILLLCSLFVAGCSGKTPALSGADTGTTARLHTYIGLDASQSARPHLGGYTLLSGQIATRLNADTDALTLFRLDDQVTEFSDKPATGSMEATLTAIAQNVQQVSPGAARDFCRARSRPGLAGQIRPAPERSGCRAALLARAPLDQLGAQRGAGRSGRPGDPARRLLCRAGRLAGECPSAGHGPASLQRRDGWRRQRDDVLLRRDSALVSLYRVEPVGRVSAGEA